MSAPSRKTCVDAYMLRSRWSSLNKLKTGNHDSRHPGHFPPTDIQDHTLMGALTRVLSEEYKKSVELCYNILRAFLVRGGRPGVRRKGYSDKGRSTCIDVFSPLQ